MTRNPQALKRLVANGALQHRFSQAVMEACLTASNEVKCRDLRVQPRFQEDLRFADGLPDDGNLWWQVAEYCYETFMIRIRPKSGNT